jgi:hypothetical protein
VILAQVMCLSESIAEAHVQAGPLVAARAATQAGERSVTALARVCGPVELGPEPTLAPALPPWLIDHTNLAARTPLRPGLTSRDQPVPRARRNIDRDNERGVER